MLRPQDWRGLRDLEEARCGTLGLAYAGVCELSMRLIKFKLFEKQTGAEGEGRYTHQALTCLFIPQMPTPAGVGKLHPGLPHV